MRRLAFTPQAPPDPQDAVAHVRDSFLTSRPWALAGTMPASVSHDGTRLAPALTVPTLVVHGTADPEVPADEVTELLAALPEAELVSLPGAGHMLALTEPRTVADQIARWVRHVSARARGCAVTALDGRTGAVARGGWRWAQSTGTVPRTPGSVTTTSQADADTVRRRRT